jgi:hypothetical protein
MTLLFVMIVFHEFIWNFLRKSYNFLQETIPFLEMICVVATRILNFKGKKNKKNNQIHDT